MCEQTEINYLDGEVVWVKLGSCWWPGEVVAPEKLPPDVLPSFRKPPIAVVKFFQEDTYEYVKNINFIYKYNCSRKNEFINKGLYMYRTKHGPMEKFPEDVIRAETAVGGDIEILTRDEFQETKKESYAGIFGDTPKKTPVSAKKGKGRGRPSESPKTTPVRKMKEKSDYKVHILVQGSTPNRKSIENPPATPTLNADATVAEPVDDGEKTSQENDRVIDEKPQTPEKQPSTDKPTSSFSTPTVSSAGVYSCHACSFSTSRLNVLILHNKTHSVSFMPYTPSPVKKKPVKSSVKSTPTSSKTPKTPRPRKEKTEKTSKKSVQATKRSAAEQKSLSSAKKQKTDEEIKSSLLADWDDIDEESNDESPAMVMAGSPEVPVAAESPAVPTPAELPSAQVPAEISSPVEKKQEEAPADKPESASDSKYEFREDEDWPVEADVGRKIPRIKNPKRKEDNKSLSLDDEDVAREVAELLNKTTVPELPSVPEPLKVEENFPEPSVVKSPDKQDSLKSPELTQNSEKSTTEAPPTKAIFKTKTFFRSRHSRSQDAIGKYVAEQLNAVERMDISESEVNGSDNVSSPEARDSPPIEHKKVARLAPKIQLKKMKAEAAQMREKEKSETEFSPDDYISKPINTIPEKTIVESEKSCTVALNKPDEMLESINTLQNDYLPPEETKTVEAEATNTLQNDYLPPEETKTVEAEATKETKAVVEDIASTLHNDLPTENTEKCNNDQKVNDVEPEPIHDQNSNENELFSQSKDTALPYNVLENAEKKFEQPYMNESTASAVDALLSVSREADRVTKVISDDPPEDLFEDDNKDTGPLNTVNEINETLLENNDVAESIPLSSEPNIDNDTLQENDLNSNNDLNLESKPQDVTEEVLDTECTDNKQTETLQEINSTEVPPPDALLESVPSESDLQIAETLINLPSSAMQSKNTELKENVLVTMTAENEFDTETVVESENVLEEKEYEPQEQNKVEIKLPTESTDKATNENILRFETELEKSENLNAAQSLVQMSKSIDHKINIVENKNHNSKDISKLDKFNSKQNNALEKLNSVEQKVASLSTDNSSEVPNSKTAKYETTSSKLLKILEEPCAPKVTKTTPTKQIIIPGKEKILNFEVAKSSLKSKTPVIIRRAASNKTLINNLNDLNPSETILLSRGNKMQQDGSSVHTYAIQTTPDIPADTNTITIIQQKVRKVQKTPTKLQKIKPQNSLVLTEPKVSKEASVADDTMFDINSMPIVLSDDSILTPESIEKMPIVMSDGNLITNTPNPPKLVKTKQTLIESDKPTINISVSKPEVKTLLMNPASEVSKVSTTPNILSKSSKLRGAKPMLVIDKATGKQKIIMTKAEPAVKEIKPAPTLIQPIAQNTTKAEKFIILPTAGSPRPGRTQKIVIDPQTGKAHVLVSKDSSSNINDNKPISAKLIPSSSDASGTGNTVMIITNAQGAQSRIVLTSEHEKILFPNKQQQQQQQNVSQLKTVTHRISTNSASTQKTVATTVPQVKTQTRIVPKQKSAIITSKGQLIVGGRVATTAQNIAPMPEIRPVQKRLVPAEPKKIVQTIQKTTSEPLIFLQQKSGSVVQLTASQFEHFQRTGQIIQKIAVPQESKIVQKTLTISPGEAPIPSIVQKQRVRKTVTESPTPAKKLKQEIAIAPAPSPAPAPIAPMPALTPLSNTVVTTLGPSISNTVSVTTSSYAELDNLEEMLPTTAIVRPPEPVVVPPEPVPAPPPAPLSDGQLLAVPGEHFGGPPGSFYLCVEDNGTLTPIDNRPLVLENNQLVPMAVEQVPILAPQPERRDILEAALANSDVFHAEPPRDEAPDFRDLNANVSVHCRVSETSTTLNQPIMTPVEVPSKGDSEPAVPSNLEDGLAVIGVTPHTVPTSLELPITVTDPRIAPKTTDPLSGTNYGTTLLPSPNTEMTFVTTEEVDVSVGGGPISIPLLTDEDAVGKSMPILTDEVAERTVSSVDSTIGSPSSIDVRESETEDGGQWSRRLLTPGSDTSETSSEIPLQPAIQLSVNDMSRHS